MSALPEYISRAELCRALKISTTTSRRLDRDGNGPRGVRLSRRIVRYPVADVVDFMSKRGLDVPADLARSAVSAREEHRG